MQKLGVLKIFAIHYTNIRGINDNPMVSIVVLFAPQLKTFVVSHACYFLSRLFQKYMTGFMSYSKRAKVLVQHPFSYWPIEQVPWSIFVRNDSPHASCVTTSEVNSSLKSIKCSFLRRISIFNFEKKLIKGQEDCTVERFLMKIEKTISTVGNC